MTLDLTHDFFAARLGQAKFECARDSFVIGEENPFLNNADDNYEVYENIMELREVTRDVLLQRPTLEHQTSLKWL